MLIGPQGSGNHLFSKCFASSDKIGGWKTLNEHYWKGHHTEPFNEVWQGKRDLSIDDFNGYDYWVTSVSMPFVCDGELALPHVHDFYNQAVALGVDARLGLITRDKNILELQQARVRNKPTLPQFMQYFNDRMLPMHYLSHETLVLHKQNYMNYICELFGFPSINANTIKAVLAGSNANKKYIKNVEEHWLDAEVHLATADSKKQEN